MNAQAGSPEQEGPAPRRSRWVWPIVIAVLAVLGVLLALADMTLDSPMLGPLSQAIVGPSVVAERSGRPATSDRFERTGSIQAFSFTSPFRPLRPISPFQALRALLSNGAGLIFIALAVLVVFPGRVRTAVQRLESRLGPVIALAAGVATLLLTLAALLLLRFTLIYLILIPVLVAIAVAVTIFGLACIALALGRALEARLRLHGAHPLVVSLAGTLIVFDVAVIPYAGVFALAAFAIAGLGLAVVSRFGSATGWSFSDLRW